MAQAASSKPPSAETLPTYTGKNDCRWCARRSSWPFHADNGLSRRTDLRASESWRLVFVTGAVCADSYSFGHRGHIVEPRSRLSSTVHLWMITALSPSLFPQLRQTRWPWWPIRSQRGSGTQSHQRCGAPTKPPPASNSTDQKARADFSLHRSQAAATSQLIAESTQHHGSPGGSARCSIIRTLLAYEKKK